MAVWEALSHGHSYAFYIAVFALSAVRAAGCRVAERAVAPTIVLV